MANPIGAFKKIVGGITVAAGLFKKGKAVVEAAAEDTKFDDDDVPQYQNLKEKYPIVLAKGKEFVIEVKAFALLAYDLFLHIVERGSDA